MTGPRPADGIPGGRPEGPGRVTPATLARLARTRSAPGDVALLLDGLHSGRLLLLKSLLTRLERPPAVPGPARARFEEHWRLLEHAEAHHPDRVAETLDYPSVGTWLAHTLAAPDGETLALRLGHFGAVAATAALRAGADFALDLPAPGGRLALPGTGLLRTTDSPVRLTAHGPAARLAPPGGHGGALLLRAAGRVTGHGPGWQGLLRLAGGPVRLDDLDPYRAPPGGAGRYALPAAPRTAGGPWARHWRAALALLRAADPARATEVTALLRCLVPLAPAGRPGTKVSATYRVAPGAVLTTPPSSPWELAEVLVHETQHGKLAVLHDLVPLHAPPPHGRPALHRVAWRPDPRPVGGVLQGAYAHLALADLRVRAALLPGLTPTARHEARTRRDSCLRQVARALNILLESAELTPAGGEFVIAMERHLAGLTRPGGPDVTIGTASPVGDVR
ncbi:aKG-HExxH-type peptide beta-hydroxylase [Streptomyces hesseae]|uniref:HEXXH motif-containing putative peptide modification protein n=1 Tax=Streptomyces hesseae TaxID=3075519 RepID=A0ABU2SQP3_9ACTN|nr:HEXXH motif-containing putative peptide modification protein [Streptomyces sp. DSM 40473]MDT0450961.1 HEXXH motif-containing putative peptide modification protein [Streptomyces sp. DSM 40473]